MKDPISGKLITNKEDIKETFINYCAEVLKKNPPSEGFETEFEIKNALHDLRMVEDHDVIDEREEISEEDFDEAIKKFKKKNKKAYNYIVKAGDSFKEGIFKFMERIHLEENLPSSWENTVLVQIYKGKGARELLENNRYIHSKHWKPKLYEAMVVAKSKPLISNNTSIYQIGGVAGHRPQEHIFVMKSVISLYSMLGKALILEFFDITKYFDRENLRDVMNNLYVAGVVGKLYRMWFKMNKNSRIRVRTGLGLSSERSTGELIAQGTVGGALVSGFNLDKDIFDYFEESSDEVYYGGVRLQPLCYQDDLLQVASSVNKAQIGNKRVEFVMKSKQLEVHPTKTGFVLSGKKVSIEKIRNEITSNPLKYGNLTLKEKSSEKWLGEQMATGGNTESVLATIKARKGKAIAAIYEIKAVIDDIRASAVGGILAGLDLWEKAVIPMLLNNADTWTDMNEEAWKELNYIQNHFMRALFELPVGSPKPILCWDTASLSMENRVNLKKLNLAVHLKKLDKSSLAGQVFDTQIKNRWPGLCKEVKDICREWNIDNVCASGSDSNSKMEWKKILKEAAHEKNENDLRDAMESLEKLEDVKNEKYEMKSYLNDMSMKDARMMMRIRGRMVKCKMNFSSERVNIETSWKCRACCSGAIETQSHILYCEAYKPLREGKSLSSDEDIVDYYRKVSELREKLGI